MEYLQGSKIWLRDSAPTVNDLGPEGVTWIDRTTNIPYILVDVTAGVAEWMLFGAGMEEVEESTDPAANAAVTPTIIQSYSGVVVDTDLGTDQRLPLVASGGGYAFTAGDSDDQGGTYFYGTYFSIGTTNYVAYANDSGVVVYSVSPSGALTLVDSDSNPSSSRRVAWDGTYLYVSDEVAPVYSAVRAYSFDGTTLTYLGASTAADAGPGYDVKVVTTGVIVTAEGTAKVRTYTFDGTTFTNVDTEEFSGGEVFVGLATDGTYFYAISRRSGEDSIIVMSIDNSGNITKKDELDLYAANNAISGKVYDVTVADGTIYIACDDVGIAIVKFDGTTLTYSSVHDDGDGAYYRGIDTDGTYVFAGTSSGATLYIYTTDGTDLTQIKKQTPGYGGYGVIYDATHFTVFYGRGGSGLNTYLFGNSVDVPVGTVFLVSNKSSSTVAFDAIGYTAITLQPGEGQKFIYDGNDWIPTAGVDADDIDFVPTITYLTATKVQSAIDGFAPTAVKTAEANRALVPDGSLDLDGLNKFGLTGDIAMSDTKGIIWAATDSMKRSAANTMTLSGFTTWDFGAVTTLDFDGSVQLTTDSNGDISLVPNGTGVVKLHTHWQFDDLAFTALTDNDTTFNAYAGKNITIESVTFDGGVVGSVSSLTFNLGTTVNEFSIDGTLGDNSDDAVPTEKAVKTYVDTVAAAQDEFIELTDTPGSYTTANALYTTNGTPDAIIETTVILTEAANTFNITKGTASLDIAAGAALDVDANLSVEAASAINQDVTSDAKPEFAGVTLTAEVDLSTGVVLDWNSTDKLTHSANMMTLSGFTSWDFGAVATLDFDAGVVFTPAGNANQLNLLAGGQNIMGAATALGATAVGHLELQKENAPGALYLARADADLSDGENLGAIRWVGNDTQWVTSQLASEIRTEVSGAQAGAHPKADIWFYTANTAAADVSAGIHADGMLDLYGGTITILAGADDEAKTRGATSNKQFTLAMPHYKLAEDYVGLIHGDVTNVSSILNLGGISTNYNAASFIRILGTSDFEDKTKVAEIARFQGGAGVAQVMGLGNSSLESWKSDFTALQIGTNGTLYNYNTGTQNTQLGHNIYYSSGNAYRAITGDAAARIFMDDNGTIQFTVYGAPAAFAGDGSASDNFSSSTTALTIANDASATFGGDVYLNESKDLYIVGAESDKATIYMYADEGDDNLDKWRVRAGDGGSFTIANYGSGAYNSRITIESDVADNGLITLNGGTAGVDIRDVLTITGAQADAAVLNLFADEGDDNADKVRTVMEAGGAWAFQTYRSGSWTDVFELSPDAAGGGTASFPGIGSNKTITVNISGGTRITCAQTYGSNYGLYVTRLDSLADWQVYFDGTNDGIYYNTFPSGPPSYHEHIFQVQGGESFRVTRNTGVSGFDGGRFTGAEGQAVELHLYADEGDDNADKWRHAVADGGVYTLEHYGTGSWVANLTHSATALSPGVTDAQALGTTSLMWSDLFLASGGVINWNDGNVTQTHSALQMEWSIGDNTFTMSDGAFTITAGEGDGAYLYLYADQGDDNDDKYRLQVNTSGNFSIESYSDGSWDADFNYDGSAGTFGFGTGAQSTNLFSITSTNNITKTIYVSHADDGTTNPVIFDMTLSHTSGDTTSIYGINQSIGAQAGSPKTGTIQYAYGYYMSLVGSDNSAIVRNAYGLYINKVKAINTDAGNDHYAYGIYIADGIAASGGDNNYAYAIYSLAQEPSLLSGELLMANQTAPSAVTGFAQLYAATDTDVELYGMDDAGNATKLTPHDDLGEWEFYSKNCKTGRVVNVKMEKLVRFLDEQFGTDFFNEWTEEIAEA